MEYITDLTNFQMDTSSIVSLGKFDGLHRGHQKLLTKMKEWCTGGEKTVVFTFSVPPQAALSGNGLSVLTTNEERRALLEREGIDYCVECPFGPEISHMTPEQFIREILVSRLRVKELVVGTDFHFGYRRSGNCGTLMAFADSCGYRLHVVEKEVYEGREISSTYVREEVKQGHMEVAEALLGYPYMIRGTVAHGRQIGRKTLGMPTVNLMPPADKLLPPNGVYVSMTRVDDVIYQGMTNIGYKPTVGGETSVGVETFLFDYEGDLYGNYIEVGLLNFEREERRFGCMDALKEQMEKDIQYGITYFAKNMNNL